jgi:hypothetical protein
MPCNIELGLLAEMSRGEDRELAQECSDMINRAFQVQADCMALAERLKAEAIASLESKHLAALLLKAELDKELGKLNHQSWDLQNESARIAGRLQQSQHRLSDHLELKNHWIPALLLPASKMEWEVKRDQLQQAVDSARNLQADIHLETNALNNDLESLAHRIRTVTGEAITLYARIQRLKGSKEPIMDSGTGLAV